MQFQRNLPIALHGAVDHRVFPVLVVCPLCKEILISHGLEIAISSVVHNHADSVGVDKVNLQPERM